MSETVRRPVIGVPSSRMLNPAARMHSYSTGERNVQSVLEYIDCLPIQIPPLGDQYAVKQLVGMLDGLLLPGGRANVEPHHYGGPAFPDDEIIDPGRDAVVLKLIPACLEAGVPMFGICRGIQEMNVALGGTLHYRVHMLDGKNDHRMPRREGMSTEEIFALRHLVHLKRGGMFEKLCGKSEIMVNSLHGQGIDRLAADFEVEAVSDDGLVEGVRLKNGGTQFAVGIQWHGEYEPQKHVLADAIYKEFAKAVEACAQRKA
jgi:putative glutamine amidotransferase